MDFRAIKKLVLLMNENDLTRLEVEEEGRRYLLEKGGAARDSMAPAGLPAEAGRSPEAVARTPGDNDGAPASVEDTVTFNSPMVGTFYRATAPDAEPFVEPGDHITPETTICIIEAMKVFNEIRAEMAGTIVEVLADNAEGVEYNQPLFLIRPD